MQIKFNQLATQLGALIIAASTLAACENRQKAGETKVPEQQEIATETTVAETGKVAFRDQKGQVVTLDSLKGKVVFINFWATWCPPCIHEMPSINSLWSTFKGNQHIEFLMVDVDNDIEKSAAFFKENSYDLPLYTPSGDIPPEFLGASIPTTVILDKNGQIVERLEGSRDYAAPEITKALEELINAN